MIGDTLDTSTPGRFLQPVLDEDPVAYGALFREDAVQHEPMFPEPARGRAAIVAGESTLFDAFGDIDIDVRSYLTSGPTHVLEVVMSATNDGPLDLGGGTTLPPTHRRMRIPMVWVLQLDDEGLIAEERDYFDPAILFEQLGLGQDTPADDPATAP